MVPGLGSQQIAQLTVTPDGGAGAVEALTDNAAGTAEASLATFFDYEDGGSGGGSPLPPAYRLGVPNDGFVQVSFQTPGAKDVQTVTLATRGVWTPVQAWSDSWVSTGQTGETFTAEARAVGGAGNLKELAYDVTGDRSDWTQIVVPVGATLPGDGSSVQAGTTVNAGLLVKILDQRLRANIVAATRTATQLANDRTAKFGKESRWQQALVASMSEQRIRDLFSEKAGGTFLCGTMAHLVEAYGVITTLLPGDFNSLMGTMTGFYTQIWTETRKVPAAQPWDPTMTDAQMAARDAALQKLMNAEVGQGELSYIENLPGVTNPVAVGENVIKVGDGAYWGWCNTPSSQSYGWYTSWLAALYDPGNPPQHIPGFNGEIVFPNVARIAQAVLSLREKEGAYSQAFPDG
jgi:hypothetical protein